MTKSSVIQPLKMKVVKMTVNWESLRTVEMEKMPKNDGQNAQNDNEEPAVVDGDAAVAAIIGPYQNKPPPWAREREENNKITGMQDL